MSCSINKNIDINIDKKNPTEFQFNAAINEVKTAIINNFSKWQFCGYGLFYKEKFPAKIFSINGNENDFLLHTRSPNCSSKVYYRKNGIPYLYFAEFHIHLDSLNSNSTSVKIITSETEIQTGLSLLPTIPHFQRAWRYKEVPPTTVEEYEILLIIGKALGVNNMPALIIPEKIIIK